MKKLSIIIPVYNACEFLRRCLDSVLSQSYKDFEVLCIDDNSDDNSLEILMEYQKKDERVKIFKSDCNQGVAVSRNYLLKKAQGEYVQFLDADDYLSNDALGVFQDVYKKNIDIAFFRCNIVSNDEKIDITRVPAGIINCYEDVYNGLELLGRFVKANEFFYYPAMLFIKKKFICDNNIGFTCLKVGEGGEFVIKCLINAKKVIVLNDKIYNYYIHCESATRKNENSNELLLGNIVQYASVLKEALLYPEDKNIDLFLKEHLKKISGIIINLSCIDREKIFSKLSDKWERHIFNTIINSVSQNKFDISKEQLEILKDKKNVIIYGAGNTFKDVLRIINDNEIVVKAVAVSDYNNNPRALYGHRVLLIKDLAQYANESSVLIAVKKKYHEEIIKTILRYGFKSYVCLDVSI